MDPTFAEEPQGPGIGTLLSQLPTILKQRKWWIIVPTVLGVVGAVLALLFMRPVYESSALMLVESAQVQDELLTQTASDVIDRRIARIRAEVVSRPNLVALIERHRLYADERDSKSLSQIIEEMREAITLTPTTVEVPGGGAENRTIAFQLTYQYTEPRATQAVTQDLMDRILELDATGNVEQATNTVQFLSDQAADLETQIAGVQNQINTVTARNGGVLAGAGGAIVGGSGGSYDVQISALQRDNATLTAQKAQLATADNRDPGVLAAEARLASLRGVYTEGHPDVVAARNQLAQAKALARDNLTRLPTETIDQQIAFNNSQIAALRAARAGEQASINSRLAASARAPIVEQQLATLQQTLTGLNTQYQEVQARLASARAGVKAEDEQIAERLSVVDPPVVPDEPVNFDRLLITALSILGGLGLGIVLALAVEFLFRPIRDPDSLAAITGESPLAVVPVIASKRTGEKTRSWRRLLPRLPRLTRSRKAA